MVIWDKLPNIPDAWHDLLDRKVIKQFVVPTRELNLSYTTILEGPVLPNEAAIAHTTNLSFMTTLLTPQQAIYSQPEHPLAAHEQAKLPAEVSGILHSVHCAEVGHGGTDRTLELIAQLRT